MLEPTAGARGRARAVTARILLTARFAITAARVVRKKCLVCCRNECHIHPSPSVRRGAGAMANPSRGFLMCKKVCLLGPLLSRSGSAIRRRRKAPCTRARSRWQPGLAAPRESIKRVMPDDEGPSRAQVILWPSLGPRWALPARCNRGAPCPPRAGRFPPFIR